VVSVSSPTAYSRPGWSGSGYVAELPVGVDINAEFGASTALADNSTAINNALSTLGPLGLEAILRPGVYKVQNEIVIGNGTNTTLSTWGASLRGLGWPPTVGLGQIPGTSGVTIQWNGSQTNNPLVLIQGPVAGCSLKNLSLDGNGVCRKPLQLQAVQYSEFHQLHMQGCYTGPVLFATNAFGSYITNTMGNDWRNIVIWWNGSPALDWNLQYAAGLYLGSSATGGNTCYQSFQNLDMWGPGTSVGNILTSIYLRGCDTNRFRNVHLGFIPGGTDVKHSVMFDYSEGGGAFPSANSLEAIDLNGIAPANNSSPSGATLNRIVTDPINGIVANPNLANLQWGWPNLTKATPTYSASITPDASAGPWQTITVTNANAFTINAPTNAPDSGHSAELTVEILNSSGGAMGAITWNAAFVLVGGAFTNPASTKKRCIRFEWNGANWIETSRAGADY
jgi:hypothetical protein